MPKGKKIYEDLSKKYAERCEARTKRAEGKNRDKDGKPIKPATINNFKVNKPQMARSLNFSPIVPKLRKISKTEGQPIVNASTDVRKLIHKPKAASQGPLDNPTAGAIKEETAPKRRGRPSGSTKKTGQRTTRKKIENAKTKSRGT